MVSQLIHFLLSCDNSTHVKECCAVIGPALFRAAKQTTVKGVNRSLPLFRNGVWPRETTLLLLLQLWISLPFVFCHSQGWLLPFKRLPIFLSLSPFTASMALNTLSSVHFLLWELLFLCGNTDCTDSDYGFILLCSHGIECYWYLWRKAVYFTS